MCVSWGRSGGSEDVCVCPGVGLVDLKGVCVLRKV